MQFAALVSGGKDSLYAIQLAIDQGHALVCCIHLAKPPCEQEESFLYQSAASEAVATQIEQCLGVPLITVVRKGTSQNTSMVYENTATTTTTDTHGDEVEDLYTAVSIAQERFPHIQALSSGAILSTYQRVRIEHVCDRLGLQPLAYLWRYKPQQELLNEMIHGFGMDAVLVQTAAPPGLVPRKHLGRSLRDLQPLFQMLHDKYQFHVCGEGGEYETLVLDCPLFRSHRLVLESTSVVYDDDGDEDIAGRLVIHKCAAVPKENAVSNGGSVDDAATKQSTENIAGVAETKETTGTSGDSTLVPAGPTTHISLVPYVRKSSGGFWAISSLWSSRPSPTSDVVTEAMDIFATLQHVLQQHQCTAHDVLYVHVYLTDMAHFALLNSHYRAFFGTLLPPSRSTIAVDHLPGGRNVMLDVWVQCGSGGYLRQSSNKNPYTMAALAQSHTRLRSVLHVQSISHWAPVCVGPYSQTNTLRDCLHMVSGQIGLVPATMAFASTQSIVEEELQQACTNLAQVLDALDASRLEQAVLGIVYVAEGEETSTTFANIERLVRRQWSLNGGVTAGAVATGLTMDQSAGTDDEYEDAETAAADRSTAATVAEVTTTICPMLVVSIAQMPVGAKVEVETIVATRKAFDCLTVHDDTSVPAAVEASPDGASEAALGWDTGHDFVSHDHSNSNAVPSKSSFVCQAAFRTLGHGGVCCGVVTAMAASQDVQFVDLSMVLRSMAQQLLKKTSEWFHLRLYFEKDVFDRETVRLALQSIVVKHFAVEPAMTVVPVGTIRMFHGIADQKQQTSVAVAPRPLLAIQALSLDPVLLQDEVWIRFGRS